VLDYPCVHAYLHATLSRKLHIWRASRVDNPLAMRPIDVPARPSLCLATRAICICCAVQRTAAGEPARWLGSRRRAPDRAAAKASATRHRHVTVTLYYCPGRIIAPPISRGAVMFDPISSDAIFAVLVVVDVVAIIGLAALFFWPRRWLGGSGPPASRRR
jgi:hypothetical protein